MNVAIMVCHKMTYDCTGVGCFKSFNDKRDAFTGYTDQTLLSLFHCNGCGEPLFKGMAYKFEQLKRSDVKTIHMARCIEVECHRYSAIHDELISRGFDVVKGSHT